MIEGFYKLRAIHKTFDGIGVSLESLGLPLCMQCGKCCTQNTITINSIEANLIISMLIGNGKASEVLSTAKDWLLEKNAEIYEGIPRGVITDKLREEWNSLTFLPCILQHNKLCTVHKVRPIICRAYGISRAPSESCSRPRINGEHYFVNNDDLSPLRKRIDDFHLWAKNKNPDWVTSGFLPTMLYRQGREKDFRELILDNKIASAKLVGTNYETTKVWEFEVDTYAATNIVR